MTSTKRKVNSLKAHEKFSLNTWLAANYDRLASCSASYGLASHEAADALGLHVTQGNLVGALRAIGKPGWGGDSAMVRRRHNHRRKIDLLILTLEGLFVSLGREVPPALVEDADLVRREIEEDRATQT